MHITRSTSRIEIVDALRGFAVIRLLPGRTFRNIEPGRSYRVDVVLEEMG